MKQSDRDREILKAMREFRQRAESYWHDIYKQASDDIEFVVNKDAQWDATARAERKRDGRPCLSINKLALFVKQQVNSLRANKLTLNAIPIDDGDITKAQIQDDMLEYILKSSKSDVATDWAYERAVMGGFGFVLVTTEYSDALSFYQDIKIKRIENPQSTYISPESLNPTGADATEAITGEWISKAEFKRQYPNAEPVSVECNDFSDWQADDERVFVAEYYRIEYQHDILYLLQDGQTILKSELSKYQDDTGFMVVDKRPTQIKKVMWYKCSRDEILEKTELPFDFIPLILVVGDEQWVGNKRYWQSMITNAKDPQILYNYVRTGQAEQLRRAMSRPWVADGKAIEGYENYWKQANNPNLVFLPYNSTDERDRPLSPPFLANVYQGSPDLMREAMTTSDEIKATTGIFDASLGSQGNETSGRAILARQRQGDQANFHFLDNFKRSYEHLGRVILSAVPKVYDTPRVLRIALDDGEEQNFKTILVNIEHNSQLAGKYQKELEQVQAVNGMYNDLSIGKYDVRIATGADYNTQREESRELLMDLGRNNPQLMQIAGDLIVKAFDFKDANKLAERLKKAMPSQLQDDSQVDIPLHLQTQIKQMQQAMQQMQMQLQQAQGEIANREAQIQKELQIAQMKAETDLQVAKIREAGRSDQEEIKGMVQLLLQRLQVPDDWKAEGEDVTSYQSENPQNFKQYLNPVNEQGFLMPNDMATQMPQSEQIPQPINATDGDFANDSSDLDADQAIYGDK